jgi:diacylglycerol kinase family enzyme
VRHALFVNPRSGSGPSAVDELVAEAERYGVEVHLLRTGEDLTALARAADADVLGAAGGDGTLGAVAGAAVDRALPFVCVPFGTRNHFARDAGLGDDPLHALKAFRGGSERCVDVGRIEDRVFLNNVSLGLYARLVHRREHHRRRRNALARFRAPGLSVLDRRWTERFVVDGQPIRASVVLVANNAYRLDVLSLGARERIDQGALVVYAAQGLRRLRWTERSATEVRIETSRPRTRVAVDGEPARLSSPLRLRIEPGALRLLVPEDAPG